MKKFAFLVFATIISSVPSFVIAQQNPLREKIIQFAKPANGIVGVSILGLESRDTLNYNGAARLVMHSVIKFPIALTVLHLVDTGKLSLNQTVHINKKDFLKNTQSPLRDKYPKGKIDLPVSELLSYMVSQSDNNACDILLNLVGGAPAVQRYMLQSGIRGIAVRASEADMALSWELQYTNWCKPAEMTMLLDLFYKGSILSKVNTGLLLKMMSDSDTGTNRIKGLLPPGTVVAHKTGTSPTNAEGLSPATNDVGIITLPNGKHVAIAVFVCNSTADEATRESVIAKIAKAAYDAYSN